MDSSAGAGGCAGSGTVGQVAQGAADDCLLRGTDLRIVKPGQDALDVSPYAGVGLRSRVVRSHAQRGECRRYRDLECLAETTHIRQFGKVVAVTGKPAKKR